MNVSNQSFCEWLVNEIETILRQKTSPPPLLIWCDPQGEWLNLLRDARTSAGFSRKPAQNQGATQTRISPGI
ncbi:MAG: hypothetical protein U5R49_25065 [Deltaproteobacteria bacterium]|nr:hypothetical protein [Deltaproteobacteria bacterium]